MHPMPVRMLGSVVIAVVLVVALPAYAKTQLLVYTAVEAEELKGFSQAFTKAYPDIEIRWVRDSTGIITAKLLAEKANPRADVIWGLAATSLLLMKQENMLMPYAPPGLEKLDAKFKDADNPPFWVGQRAWAAVLCFNTIEAERRNLPKPASWQDLTKPIYKGHVAMPNPASSGTGYLDVSSWLQIFGEERGWAFMDALQWMCFENMRRLGVYPSEAVVKIGDTPVDVQEGLNAGMWTIGLAKTGNEVGLALDTWQTLAPEAQSQKLATAYNRLRQAGAHYVVDSLADVVPILDTIEARLAKGERP
jgi:2-aminoethylphosphonate ABC transporter binding protein